MKNKTTRLMSLLLCVVMLLAALPMLPTASAATPYDLRQAVAAHAKNIANVEWKAEARRFTDDRMPDEHREAVKAAGACPITYYEYIRMQMLYRGPISEINSVSLEAYKAQLVDGFLPENGANIYYGMNTNSYVTDVVSRMIPTKVLSVKDALTAEGLTPLFSGLDLNAATSKEAAANVSYQDAQVAYGKLGVGDILFAWDDDTAPGVHALVITDMNTQNRGTMTVTYPSYTYPIYHFTCSKCGTKSTEGPTGSVISKHMESFNYAFSRWKTHKETYPDSNCDGEWMPEGGTTWNTTTVTFDQLFGHNGEKVLYGIKDGNCYLPYTFDAYATGKPVPVEVKVTTDATAENITAGFKAAVESNYRIVRVDAVLSQLGKEDQVFAQYPKWDDWSYEYESAELNKALFENQTGEYTLTLNVHSGPMEDPANPVAPVTEVFKLDLQLSDPSVFVTVSDSFVHQGQNVILTMKSVEDGLTGAQMVVSGDPVRFAFNRKESERMNPGVKFVENADGTVTVSWFGSAAKKNQTLAQVVYTAVRTGEEPADARAFSFGHGQVSKKAGATADDLALARVGGEQPEMSVGWNIAIYEDYAPGCDLVLLLAHASEATVTYDGKAMLDITQTNWEVDGKGFSHVYGYVTTDADADKVAVKYTGLSFSASSMNRQTTVNKDVNRDGGVDIADVQAVLYMLRGVYPLEGNVEAFLMADVNHNGKVEMSDAQAILATLK